ncbi:endonuclease [Oceanobacillus neutriphilus]|uniref:Homing endonuclease LAGLIDADG domain-containing protein n=1 Tax=Oceanobacillus neutriphilus TaxID=531815 RepID=A0ABQ2NMW5_9BACI|nr:endonuclease [Oceanobacillus neutriphilus]GGP07379.1 hypothetical protein GCM10011346_03130 [Oceanobacillus neutriphilus]
MDNDKFESYIIKNFPIKTTKEVAEYLNVTPHVIRSIAKKYSLKKSETHLAKLKLQFVEHRRKWYEANIPLFKPNKIQEQIIFGSLLGDGYISKGAQRSKNFYYQEHFGENQREYRFWKLSQLESLGFEINGNYLRSPSHPFFTKLHQLLYNGSEKILKREFLSKCLHPAFLASLYLDDGSLVLSYNYNKSKHIVYCHPSIILYTLNFNKEENHLLASHLNQTFNINFVVSGHPDGKGSLLKMNKEKEVRKFLRVIEPYSKEIPSMLYKTNMENKLNEKTEEIYERYGNDVIIKLSSSNRKKLYSNKEIETIIHLKRTGSTDQNIADNLGRSYWSVVYKIRELRKNRLL